MTDEDVPVDPSTFDATNDAEDADEVSREEDEDEYDPTSFASEDHSNDATADNAANDTSENASRIVSQTNSRSGSTLPPTKPLVAGFIIEESDEEDSADGNPENGISSGAVKEEGIADASQAQQIQIGSTPATGSTSAVPSAQETSITNGSAPDQAPVHAPVPSDMSSAFPVLATNGALSPSQPPTAVHSESTSLNNTFAQSHATSTRRLAHDKVGQLEDRIVDEPRADPEAFVSLIAHYKDKNQLDNVRKTYERFVEVFPSSPSIWLEYLNLEQENDEAGRIDKLLERALPASKNVDLCLFYINVLRRRNPLINDVHGKSRQVISQAFDYVLEQVGIDPDAGKLWREYIEFIKSGPGTVSATSTHWQDQQKVDLLRKAYHKAVTLPNDEVVKLWKEYDTFELSFNRATGRKFLNERSPHYMTAKAAKIQLDERLNGLDRTSLPRLPPLPGFAGDAEFANQLQRWRDWIAWEKSDELVLKQEELEAYRKRVDYAYTQATESLRFFPEIWFDAACWCFEQATEHWKKLGEKYLDSGIAANPESPLLALRKADLVESGFKGSSDSDDIAIQNGNKLDVVYEKVHNALYAQKKKYMQREEKAIAGVEEYYASLPPEEQATATNGEDDDDDNDDDDEDEVASKPKSREEQKQEQIKAVKFVTSGLQDTLKKTISYVWVAKLRAFRRIQGQGKPKDAKKGFRGVFSEARPRGSLTSDVYIASALMEHFCYADMAATKIFERGLRLFPTDEFFILEYIKHLISKNDLTNAKAVFETSLTKIERAEDSTPEQRRNKCRPLLVYMYQFESDYGDLAAIHRLERRMAEMYPDEGDVARFTRRFELPNVDASRTILALSPSQMRPKLAINEPLPNPIQPSAGISGTLASPQAGQVLLGPHGPYVASPKRPLDDADDNSPATKYLRGDSPLKGAAGRRIATASSAAAAAASNAAGGAGFVNKTFIPGSMPQLPQQAPAPAIPPAVYQLLAMLPPASAYQATRFVPEKMVELLRFVDLSRARR